jgi:hypothetical protein
MTFLPGRPFPETSDREQPLRALAAVQRQYAELTAEFPCPATDPSHATRLEDTGLNSKRRRQCSA